MNKKMLFAALVVLISLVACGRSHQNSERTINQSSWSGNLPAGINAATSNQRSAFQFQQSGPTPSELQNSRITGQAIIGDGRTLQINAAPVSP